MNATSVSRHRITEQDAVVVYDVDGCIRSWGRRGILSGGLFGFVLGAIFVANPLTTEALTFGTIGTLLVCGIECAVVAGAFGAAIAAFIGQGICRGNAAEWERTLATGRLYSGANRGADDIPSSALPAQWAFAVSSAMQTRSTGI